MTSYFLIYAAIAGFAFFRHIMSQQMDDEPMVFCFIIFVVCMMVGWFTVPVMIVGRTINE